MADQIVMAGMPEPDRSAKKQKRNWENAFQNWSDKNSQDGNTAFGSCGNGYICDWCTDNSYGRPCVRALNAMLRDLSVVLDYTDRDFERIWNWTIDAKGC